MKDALYLAISDYLVGADEVLESLVEHRAWTKRAYDDGIMLFSGRQDPPTGGVLAFRAADREDAEAFAATDPFVLAGVASYTIVAVNPTPLPWRSPAIDGFMSSAPHDVSVG
jgi:uncharacterized protein YciI